MTTTRCIGRLRLELRDPAGAVVATRSATNLVVQSGARLLAELFTGAVGGPINGVGVGVDGEPTAAPYERSALTTKDEGGAPLLVRPVARLADDAFQIEALAELLRVRIEIRAELPADRAQPPGGGGSVLISEAGLGFLAEGEEEQLTRLYNRVVFDTLEKEPTHDLSFFWEVEFPYGP